MWLIFYIQDYFIMSQELPLGEKGGDIDGRNTGEGVKSDDVTSEGVTTHTHDVIDKRPTQTDTQKGVSQYQLVFMEELSSGSSLTDSLSPRNLESSGSFTPVPLAAKLNTSQDHVEADESLSTVSSSTLVADSISCEIVGEREGGREGEGASGDGGREAEREEEGGKREDASRDGGTCGKAVSEGESAGEDGGGKEVKGAGLEGDGGGGKEDVNGQSDVVTKHNVDTQERKGPSDESRPQSVTPPPKPKEHSLSRYTSDSDAVVTPPLSPLEYHSSGEESESRTTTFPLLTPSPLPSGADSPDHPAMSILFSGVFYLGSSTVDAPISETEANRKMNILHEQALTSHPMPIILSVPITNDGSVLLKDPKTDQPLTTFPIKMILFCARGNDSLQDCFCLNVRHKRSGTYHCHVFRCEIIEAVSWSSLPLRSYMYML